MKAILNVYRPVAPAPAVASLNHVNYLLPPGAPSADLLTIELPFRYDAETFNDDLVRKACRRIEHPVEELYELPAARLRPLALKDVLDADIMDSNLRVRSEDSNLFSAAEVRNFIAANAKWFFARPLLARRGKAGLVETYARLTRLSVLLNLALALGRNELEGVAKVEETTEYVDPRAISDKDLEATILRLRSYDVKKSLGRELIRRALVAEDTATRFPLLAEIAAKSWTVVGRAMELYGIVYASFREDPEEAGVARFMMAPQNLRGATIDVSSASVETIGIVEAAGGLRATDLQLEAKATGAWREALTVVHRGRKVYFDAPRTLIGTVAKHGGKLQYHGNTLTVMAVDVGVTIQEMERVHALAFLDPRAVADRVLAAEPGLKAASELATRAATDTKAGQQLADLAMEVLFSIDPEVAAALIRGRQRYSAA